MLDWCSNRIARYVEVLRSQFVLCLADSVSVPSKVCDQGRSYDLRVVRVWSARARYCSECFDAKYVAYAAMHNIVHTLLQFCTKTIRKKGQNSLSRQTERVASHQIGYVIYLTICCK